MNIREAGFEQEIEEHLVNAQSYRRRDGRKSLRPPHYDLASCLDQELLFEFITSTQSESWRDLEKQHGTTVKEKFLYRLSRQISQKGTLHILRNGIKDYGCFFNLAYFRPASQLNPEHQANYQRNILSIMRQCHYSAQNENSIDLVIFLNGLPILTIELKNKLTNQRSLDAIIQYQKDRDPKNEPLLQFKRCLVHFAMDGDEVYMTTHLRGAATRFLPFNKGRDGAAGNPINPKGYTSSYLWEEILQREHLLELLGSFVHLQEEEDDEGRKREKLIFPRYHQWNGVRELLTHARTYGPGRNYLIQHSAGSGKSNSIAWLAHRLASLHNAENRRVFDSVIVVTDRRVLDRQLRNTVKQFEQTTGIVMAIEKHSGELFEALGKGSQIIITTIQKFPALLEWIKRENEKREKAKEKTEELKITGYTFAIIADEAHSSQTGESSKSLKQVLRVNSPDGVESETDLQEVSEDDPNPLTGEDLLAANMAARGQQANLSFFAFTATPKQRTLQTFGTLQPDGTYSPFHSYTMRQAIEEGFILDVLENYATHSTYFKLLKRINDDPRYPKSRAMSLMRNFVDVHDYTIAQRTMIMVEHFWENSRHKIPDENGVGQAKAMIVTRSRLHAVRYKIAVDKYLKQQGYPIKALVAFSGEVEDKTKNYTEAGMNGFSDKQTADTFKKPEYRFMIVAEKFQTGFDQPLLHTMYVDKKLDGVAAVQTLSRLNRTHPGKTDTMVLDFVNEAEHIREAFSRYYETTLLSEGTDPNKLYDLYDTLAEYRLYIADEVAEIVELFLQKGEKAAKLQPLLRAIVTRYEYIVDTAERQEFKSKLSSYIRLYAFLSQLISFQDVDLERLYLFARLLIRMLRDDKERLLLNVAENVDLESYRVQQTSQGKIELARGEGWLSPLSELEMIEQDRSEQAELSKIIAEMNDRFGTEFDEGDRVFFAELRTRLASHESLQQSAKVNSRENVRLLHDVLFNAVLQTMIESNFDLFKRINDDVEFGRVIREKLFDQVYREIWVRQDESRDAN
jgi:type I restriction enzyme R subunit